MKPGNRNRGHTGSIDPGHHRAVKSDGDFARTRANEEASKNGRAPKASKASRSRSSENGLARMTARDGETGGTALSGPVSVLGPGSFAGHYGQLILTDGTAPIPRALYLYQGALNLSPQQIWFISCMLSHKWDDGLPHPRLQELARHATLSLRQIKNIKNSLQEAGLLRVTPRYGTEGEQDANSYDFGMLFDKLEKLIVADLSPRGAPMAAGAGAGAGARAPGTSGDAGDAGARPHYTTEDELADGPHLPGIQCGSVGGEIEDYVLEERATKAKGDIAGKIGDAGMESKQGAGKDYSFAARFGRIVLRRGVAAIPRALFTYQGEMGLTPQQLWFIGYILSFQWSTELPYPSLRRMAANTGYSERQIHRIKDSLVSGGYLRVVERRGADGRDTTSAYDFSALLETLNTLIRSHNSDTRGKSSRQGPEVAGGANRQQRLTGQTEKQESAPRTWSQSPYPHPVPPDHSDHARQSNQSDHPHCSELSDPSEDFVHLDHIRKGGEAGVSGGVKLTPVDREAHVSGRVNPTSERGVKPVSVGGVNCMSYEIESVKEEADKEEPHQQQPALELDEAQEAQQDAYYTLVDVGVVPSIALDLVKRREPDDILGWVRYYLSVLSQQKSLDNPLGVLVNRLRSGDEPPYVPSPADLQGLRLQLSRYR